MKSVLKVITGILIIIEIIVTFFGFFETLSEGLVSALITLAVSIALLAPLVAIWLLLSEVELLEIKVNYLENEYRRRNIENTPPALNQIPTAQKGRNAITSWTCAKCGTVNKENTSNCENCGSAY